ncbi:retrovirus-related pol polyprotein from transposon TNT 1-94 [Tanacetum coccineum]
MASEIKPSLRLISHFVLANVYFYSGTLIRSTLYSVESRTTAEILKTALGDRSTRFRYFRPSLTLLMIAAMSSLRVCSDLISCTLAYHYLSARVSSALFTAESVPPPFYTRARYVALYADENQYVLVIVDDYSRYMWVHFLRSKDKAPEEIKTFLKKIRVLLQAPVIIVRTDNGTEFKNQVLKEYFDSVGISHQASSVRTPQQNGDQLPLRATLKTASSFTAISTKHHTSSLTVENRISHFYMYSGLFVIPRMTVRTLESLVQKKIMETMNVTFDELSAMAFEQRNSKPGLQGMTSGQISSGLDLTYAPSTITTQKPTERELDLLFEAMYDDYIGGQPSAATRTTPAAQAPQVLQTPTATTTIADTAPTPTNLFSQATNIPNTSPDVDELETQQQHVQQQNNQALLQPESIVGQYGDMCMYALTVITMEPSIVKEALKDPAWIESMQEELLRFKRLDVSVLVPTPDNIKPLTLKWLFKNKHDEENTVIRNKTRLVVRGNVYMYQPEGFIDVDHPSHVYKLKKALYGLKQAPRAWLSQPRSTSKRLKGSFVIFEELSIWVSGEKLVSWSSKKQDCTTLSTAEAEYMSLSTCYTQVIWMRTQLTDYGFHFNKIPIYCDSKSAIAISCNPVQHTRTKYIAIRYHFIKEHVEKGTIELYFVKTDYQLADLFAKALSVDRLNYLVCRLGMRSLSLTELERLGKSR